jgi:transcriptional regulator with XRE-family HTH domain
MMTPTQLARVRASMALSQEQMARLLGVSFASVNRWEGGHSGVTGSTLDLYEALASALRAGYTREQILQGANNRGVFLYNLFRMAYSGKPVRTRKAI